MTPKSLLRAAETSCAAADLTDGGFRPVIEDPRMADRRERVRVLLLCTGKVGLGAGGARAPRARRRPGHRPRGAPRPPPLDEILEMVRSYPNLEKLFWVQEEPENMGAWAHVQRRIGRHRPYEVSWEYIGRPRRASPSEGYHGSHVTEQERVLREALLTSPAVQELVAGTRPQLAEAGPAAAPGEVTEAPATPAAARAGRRRVALAAPVTQLDGVPVAPGMAPPPRRSRRSRP